MERVAGGPYPSLVAEILRVGVGARNYIGRAAKAGGLSAIKIGSLVIPTDESGRMWIAYRPLDRDRWISAADVLAGKFDPAEIRDRIVLVGSSGSGLYDLHGTPSGVGIPGVEIQAQAIDQAVQEWFLTRPSWAADAELLFAAAAALGITLVLYCFSALKAGILAGYALAFAWGLSWWAFRADNLIIDPLFPSLVILPVYVSALVLAFVQSERRSGHRLRRA